MRFCVPRPLGFAHNTTDFVDVSGAMLSHAQARTDFAYPLTASKSARTQVFPEQRVSTLAVGTANHRVFVESPMLHIGDCGEVIGIATRPIATQMMDLDVLRNVLTEATIGRAMCVGEGAIRHRRQPVSSAFRAIPVPASGGGIDGRTLREVRNVTAYGLYCHKLNLPQMALSRNTVS